MMPRYKPGDGRSAYLIGGAIFPAGGAEINPHVPFYARQIAEGGLVRASTKTPKTDKGARSAPPKGKDDGS